jgi:hypothetical protein
VNIGKNLVVVKAAGQLDTIAQLVTSGAGGPNFESGYFNGKGINSSAAASEGTTAVGFANAGFLGVSTFGSATGLTGDETLIRYTLFGDLDLNGTVDGTDYDTMKFYFGTTSGMTWQEGDLDYNGTVDGLDYDVLKFNYGATLPAAPSLASAPGVVPEPATLVLLGLGAVALLKRRNNKV